MNRSSAALVPTSAILLAVGAWLGVTLQGQRTEAKADGTRIKSVEKADVKAIKDLIAKYAKSVDDADTTLAAKVWLDSPDVSFIHPRGHEHGWKEVKENVYEKLMGKTFSKRKLSVRDVEVKVYGGAAVAVFYWNFVAEPRSGGPTLKTQGRETQVYQKGERGWALVHVHYSGMPVKGKREGF
jgi:ketosteroid isomerase-like protein